MPDPLDDLIDRALGGGGGGDKPTVEKNLGGGVFEDEAGLFKRVPAPGGRGGTVKRYISEYEAEQILRATVPEDSGGDGGGGSTGLTFEQRKELAGIPSVSFSTSQSLADPAALAIQRDQLAESIRANLAQEARDNELLAFNRDKFRHEQQRGKKADALATRTLMETIASRIDSGRIAREQMAAQAANLDRQIEAAAAEGQRGRAFDAALTQFDAEQRGREGVANRNLTREQIAAQSAQADRAAREARDRAIAEFSREPGDVGVISALLQRGGLSNVSTAVGEGESAITDRSLGPLGSMLDPELNKPSYTPEFETYQEPDRGWLNAMIAAVNQPPVAAAAPTAVAPEVVPDVEQEAVTSLLGSLSREDLEAGVGNELVSRGVDDPAARANALTEALNKAGFRRPPKAADGAAVVEPGILNGLMAMAEMLGMEPKAVAGERGKASGETVMSNGDVVILPDKGKAGSGKREMQEGGGVLNPLIALAREFMTRTGGETLDRSGFERSPTPVQLATPGTSPFTRRLGAATTATTRGIPQEVFLNELMRLIPQGLAMGTRGRTI